MNRNYLENATLKAVRFAKYLSTQQGGVCLPIWLAELEEGGGKVVADLVWRLVTEVMPPRQSVHGPVQEEIPGEVTRTLIKVFCGYAVDDEENVLSNDSEPENNDDLVDQLMRVVSQAHHEGQRDVLFQTGAPYFRRDILNILKGEEQ